LGRWGGEALHWGLEGHKGRKKAINLTDRGRIWVKQYEKKKKKKKPSSVRGKGGVPRYVDSKKQTEE